jgi:hypothetical protein
MKRNVSALNLRKTLFFLSLNALNIKVTLHSPNAFQHIVLLLQARRAAAQQTRCAFCIAAKLPAATHFSDNYRRSSCTMDDYWCR